MVVPDPDSDDFSASSDDDAQKKTATTTPIQIGVPVRIVSYKIDDQFATHRTWHDGTIKGTRPKDWDNPDVDLEYRSHFPSNRDVSKWYNETDTRSMMVAFVEAHDEKSPQDKDDRARCTGPKQRSIVSEAVGVCGRVVMSASKETIVTQVVDAVVPSTQTYASGTVVLEGYEANLDSHPYEAPIYIYDAKRKRYVPGKLTGIQYAYATNHTDVPSKVLYDCRFETRPITNVTGATRTQMLAYMRNIIPYQQQDVDKFCPPDKQEAAQAKNLPRNNKRKRIGKVETAVEAMSVLDNAELQDNADEAAPAELSTTAGTANAAATATSAALSASQQDTLPIGSVAKNSQPEYIPPRSDPFVHPPTPAFKPCTQPLAPPTIGTEVPPVPEPTTEGTNPVRNATDPSAPATITQSMPVPTASDGKPDPVNKPTTHVQAVPDPTHDGVTTLRNDTDPSAPATVTQSMPVPTASEGNPEPVTKPAPQAPEPDPKVTTPEQAVPATARDETTTVLNPLHLVVGDIVQLQSASGNSRLSDENSDAGGSECNDGESADDRDMTFGMQLEKQAERNLARDAADSVAFKRFKEAETARLIAEKDAIRLERKQQAQKIRGLWFQLTGLDQHAATLPQHDERYDLQQRIQEFNPGDRIEFRDLVRQLQKHLDDLHSNIDMSGEECTNDQDSLKSDSPSPEPPSRKNTAKKILDALTPTSALTVEELLGDAQADGHNVTKPKKKKK